MEAETMLSDDGHTADTYVKGKQSPKLSNIWKSKLLRLGIGGLTLALLATLVAVAILKSTSSIRKSTRGPETKEDVPGIVLKALFSTTHILDNGSQPLDIKNIDNIADQLNAKLNGNKIRVINALFRNYLVSTGMLCENPLGGYAMQLNIVPLYAHQCVSQEEKLCKIQRQDQLKTTFSEMSIIPITVQFDDGQVKSISIKICSLTEMIEEEEEQQQGEETTATIPRKRDAKTPATPILMAIKKSRKLLASNRNSYTPLKKSGCSLCRNKIGIVQMGDEYGVGIQDDQNQQHVTATVYEGATYRLHVQLDYGDQLGEDLSGSPCRSSLSVSVWIDFNDNGYDDGESRAVHPSWSNSDISRGTYDLDVYIPTTDGRSTMYGPHRMRLTVMPSDEYQRECGTVDYKEIRDYTVNVVSKPVYIAENTTPDRNAICSVNFAKILLIIMAGERGTEIRDDKPTNVLPSNYQNLHHMEITLYEDIVYLMRIQLDCSWQLSTDLSETGCNLAQDVSVWIDLNDDGQFDESEIGAPYRWPTTSYLPQGIYDIQIYVPTLDSRYMRTGQHRMRVAVLPTEYYRTNCGSNTYTETREYTVNIVPRTKYSAALSASTPYMVLKNIVCSSNIGKIVRVVMAGEHRTQIRDDPSTRALLNGKSRNQQHLSIILYEDITYLLRMQLECSGQRGRESLENNCHLPYDVKVWFDLNDDGEFDDSESVTPYRWPLNSYLPQGVYDLQIHVPIIDERKMKTGPHRMRLVVMPNEQYRQKCGNYEHKETRDYTITIVKNTKQPVAIGGPYLTLSDAVCTQTNGRIVLVIMAGEQGTHIRDDTPINTFISENQNRHHMAITLNENTVYRLRIQLDCEQISSRGSLSSNCNLAQDVNVLIDLNTDGQYDESESRVPQRWPLSSSMPLGIYDYEISIPAIDERYTKTGSHLMRIVVKPSDEYRNKCGDTGYSETREYTVQIVRKPAY